MERYNPFRPVLISFVFIVPGRMNEFLGCGVINLSTGMCPAGTSTGLIMCSASIKKESGALS